MFVPGQYRIADDAATLAVVREYPLATLLTNGPRVPYATHLPVIVPADRDPQAGPSLVGSTLLGHLNRANPHWRALTDGTPVVAVFAGPNTYVTPVLYEQTPAAPTWNFVAVHVHGTVHPIEGLDETIEVVRATVSVYERHFGRGWDMTSSVDYFRSIAGGVGAFRLRVEAVDSQFKLSQEKSDVIQDRLIRSFGADAYGSRQEVAALMCAMGLGVKDSGAGVAPSAGRAPVP
jgi:transcriptional regulator